MADVRFEKSFVTMRWPGSRHWIVRQLMMIPLFALFLGVSKAIGVVVGAGAFVALLAALFAFYFRERKVVEDLVVTSDGIKIGERFIPRRSIKNVSRISDPTRIVIERGTFDRIFEITMLDEHADRLEKELEIDLQHKVASVPIGAFPIHRWVSPLVIAIVLLLVPLRFHSVLESVKHFLGHAFWPLFVATFLPGLVLFIPGRAEIGRDGLMLRWLWFRRFVRAVDFADAEHMKNIVTVRLKNGERVTVPIQGFGAPKAEAVVEQLKAAFGDATEERLDDALLHDEKETTTEWVKRMRSIAERGTFRGAAVSTERLWDVLEDAHAHPRARIGAAIALSPSLDEKGRTRVRAVAEGIAAPHVRVAVQAATLDDSEEIAAALERES